MLIDFSYDKKTQQTIESLHSDIFDTRLETLK